MVIIAYDPKTLTELLENGIANQNSQDICEVVDLYMQDWEKYRNSQENYGFDCLFKAAKVIEEAKIFAHDNDAKKAILARYDVILHASENEFGIYDDNTKAILIKSRDYEFEAETKKGRVLAMCRVIDKHIDDWDKYRKKDEEFGLSSLTRAAHRLDETKDYAQNIPAKRRVLQRYESLLKASAREFGLEDKATKVLLKEMNEYRNHIEDETKNPFRRGFEIFLRLFGYKAHNDSTIEMYKGAGDKSTVVRLNNNRAS